MEQQIISKAQEFIDRWNSASQIKVNPIAHKFNLKGGVAGSFCYRPDGSHHFRWNLAIAQNNQSDYLARTVGHEVAHWIVRNIKSTAKPHGRTWKGVMLFLGCDPTRCHNYEFQAARIVERPWKYECPCGNIHTFTKQKYRNMIKDGIKEGGDLYYRCRRCKTSLNLLNITFEGGENS